jgi:hypothetical protein
MSSSSGLQLQEIVATPEANELSGSSAMQNFLVVLYQRYGQSSWRLPSQPAQVRRSR